MRYLKAAIAFTLFFPLFFKLSGEIYYSHIPLLDSGGVLKNLPLPISIIGCYLGLFVFWKYINARLSSHFIVITFVLMLLSSIMITHGNILKEPRKLLLLAQFMLPLFALILGQIFGKNNDDLILFVKAILLVLILIIPLQLYCTWSMGYKILYHSVPFFSVYQSHQYVAMTMASGFLITISCLWHDRLCRRVIYILSPLVGIYTVASFSLLSFFLLSAGFFVITFNRYRHTKDKAVWLLYLCAIFVSVAYFDFCISTWAFKAKFTPADKAEKGEMIILPKNMVDRFGDWKYYSVRIFDSTQNFLFGHERPPERSNRTSAHNYYLDFIYNYGVIAAIPLLSLIGYTTLLCFQFRRAIADSELMLGLAGVVLYNILIDNNFKVTLRQPYPGIIDTFLWGILLCKLLMMKRSGVNEKYKKMLETSDIAAGNYNYT